MITWAVGGVDAGSYPQRLAGIYSLGDRPDMGSGLTIDTAAELYNREVRLGEASHG